MNIDKNLAREIDMVSRAIASLRAPALPEEYDLHGMIARALAAAGVGYAHEYRLGPRCRIDFKVGRVGVEVKKGRPRSAPLAKQLGRYLVSGELAAVIVVTQRAVSLPERIGGKPVVLISLNRLWGVALP